MLNSVEYKEFDSNRFFGVEIEFGDSDFSYDFETIHTGVRGWRL